MPFKYNALLGLGLDNTIPLDGAGKIPSTFLPSYVDDVEEYNNLAAFPATGETGKIYVAINTGFVYRWSGSVYVQIGITAAAGSTTQVQFNDGGAFGGDSDLTFDKTTNALSAGGFIPTSSTVPTNGIYLPAANSVAVATNGNGRLFITSAGNVGIGTSGPTAILDVRQNQATYSYFDFYNITAGGGIVWRQIVRNLADTGTTSIDFVKYTSGGFAIANNDTGAANFTAFSVGASERFRITSAGVLQVADAGNIAVGTTTGTKIGTATTQKLGFYNATPVVQPAAVANATTSVDVITQLNDLLAKLRTLGIIAT